jgi:hypothetical protein
MSARGWSVNPSKHRLPSKRAHDRRQQLVVFLEERSQKRGDEPLTTEEFAQLVGELDVVQRLACLNRGDARPSLN